MREEDAQKLIDSFKEHIENGKSVQVKYDGEVYVVGFETVDSNGVLEKKFYAKRLDGKKLIPVEDIPDQLRALASADTFRNVVSFDRKDMIRKFDSAFRTSRFPSKEEFYFKPIAQGDEEAILKSLNSNPHLNILFAIYNLFLSLFILINNSPLRDIAVAISFSFERLPPLNTNNLPKK